MFIIVMIMVLMSPHTLFSWPVWSQRRHEGNLSCLCHLERPSTARIVLGFSILVYSLMLSNRSFFVLPFSALVIGDLQQAILTANVAIPYNFLLFINFYDRNGVFFVVSHTGNYVMDKFVCLFLSMRFPRDVRDFRSQMLAFCLFLFCFALCFLKLLLTFLLL